LIKRIRDKFQWVRNNKEADALLNYLDADLNLTADSFTICRTVYTGAGTDTVKWVEFPGGEVYHDVTFLPDGTQTWKRADYPSGEVALRRLPLRVRLRLHLAPNKKQAKSQKRPTRSRAA
jgi:hypothetical protein